MGSSTWVQTMVLLFLALAVIHYKNSQRMNLDSRDTTPIERAHRQTDAERPERTTASVPQIKTSLSTLGGDFTETLDPKNHGASPETSPPKPTPAGVLNGPWYRVDSATSDDDYRIVATRQKLLCRSTRRNFWLCQDNSLSLGDTGVSPEPTVQCEDCFGHVVPRIRSAELGRETWN